MWPFSSGNADPRKLINEILLKRKKIIEEENAIRQQATRILQLYDKLISVRNRIQSEKRIEEQSRLIEEGKRTKHELKESAEALLTHVHHVKLYEKAQENAAKRLKRAA